MNTVDKAREYRFRFGQNWTRFIELLTEERIHAAEESLKSMLEIKDLKGKRFLDIGSGSGLFSLAARNLGASVVSFDYDEQSVACTKELKKRYWETDGEWKISAGDALDSNYISSLGKFDVVYSWGVLHHTGDLWKALSNTESIVTPNGKLFIAIYNDQRWLSTYWKKVKRLYNNGYLLKLLVIGFHAPYFLTRQLLRTLITGTRIRERGMSPWRDVLDWLGGYPFEVARPEEIFDFYKQKNFSLDRLITVDGRHGCNEFVFTKLKDNKEL